MSNNIKYVPITDTRFQQHMNFIESIISNNDFMWFDCIDDSFFEPRGYSAIHASYNYTVISPKGVIDFFNIFKKHEGAKNAKIKILKYSDINPFEMTPNEYKAIKSVDPTWVLYYYVITGLSLTQINTMFNQIKNIIYERYGYDSFYKNVITFDVINEYLAIGYIDPAPILLR